MRVSSLRDLEFEQELDYPAVKVDIDRALAGMLGVTADQVGQSLTEATSSSRFTVPNFWADPKSGVGYQVQVEVPPPRMDSLEEVKNIPISRNQDVQIDLRNVADVTQGTVLGEYRPVQHATDADAGGQYRRRGSGRHRRPGVAGARQGRCAAAGRERGGARAGRADGRRCSAALSSGSFVAVITIFLLLAANFQSFRLSLARRAHDPRRGRGRCGRAVDHAARR